jgi:hypothetical protein
VGDERDEVPLQLLEGLTFGDVLDRDQDHLCPPVLSDQSAGVEQHDLGADSWEVVLDFEVFEVAILRQDLFEQQAQARNVPLAVAQVIE